MTAAAGLIVGRLRQLVEIALVRAVTPCDIPHLRYHVLVQIARTQRVCLIVTPDLDTVCLRVVDRTSMDATRLLDDVLL